MKLLIKDVVIHDEGIVHKEKVDIEIVDGVISSIGKVDALDHKVISESNLHCSAGWFDPFVNFGEPGHEHKENLQSGCAAAAEGGFTRVGLLPDTFPVIDNRPHLDFVAQASSQFPTKVGVHPSFVKNGQDNELSELVEMSDAGAISFRYPGRKNASAALLLKALEYAKVAQRKITVSATDFSIIPEAFMHEGMVNVGLGLRGVPSFTEELLVTKYIALLKYTGSSMHISGISSGNSVELIEKAKKQGLQISADTSVYNLLFTDENLISFDTNFKLNPPLRAEVDRKALLEGVKTGAIDVITSRHEPHEEDAKKCEMKTASFGVVGIQTLFSLLLKELKIDQVLDILVHRNRRAFQFDSPTIKEGMDAELTFFDSEKQWTFDSESNQSKSSNSMFYGKELRGRPLGIVVGKDHTFL